MLIALLANVGHYALPIGSQGSGQSAELSLVRILLNSLAQIGPNWPKMIGPK
jgi:hypothetical protein